MPKITAGGEGLIRVEGLAELQRALRGMDKTFPRVLYTANKRTAEHVARKAQARARGVSRMAARASESIVARAEQRGASVRLGNKTYPYALGAEFGSLLHRQFKDWRGNKDGAGYFLFPTIRGEKEETTEFYEQALDDVLRDAFPE